MSKKPGSKKEMHIWKALISVFLIVFVVSGILAVLKHGANQELAEEISDDEEVVSMQENTTDAEESAEEDPVDEGEGTQEFVIFGVDTRSDNLGAGTRSDSIMIVHVDYDEKSVRVLSIYRDCMVHISDHGYEKITHAHSYGGPELALATINENFDLNIENYITLNFNNLSDLVDEIGGVEVDITDEEVSYLSELEGKFCGTITESGNWLLDGTQAVKYSRIRYTSGGDYRRSERQRTVLFNLFEKAKTLSVQNRIELAEDMLAQVNSNFTTDDLISLLYYMSKYEITEMDAYPKLFYGGKIDGAWVEVPVTLVDMDAGIHEFLYGESDYSASDTVQSYSSYLQTLAGTANQDFTNTEED